MSKKSIKFKNFTLLLIIGAYFSVALSFAEEASPAGSVSLEQCYNWAKEQSEQLKITEETIIQSKARGRAAIGDALPTINWMATDTWQDPHGVDQLEAKGFSGFVEKEQVESRFTIKQPLFSGFREFSAMKGFQHESARNQLRLERQSKELFQQTADAFYAVIGHESVYQNTQEAFNLAQNRIKDLRGFLKLGKTRKSEVYTAEAYAASLQARLDFISSNIKTAREDLSFLTGQDLSNVVLVDQIPTPPVFGDLQTALARAENRSDIRAQKEEVEALKKKVRNERGYYWPHVDVTGNYYTQRATFLQDIDWDVILSVDVPFYQGGTVSARVKETMSAYRQSSLAKSQLERRVYHDIRKVYGQLTSAVKETASLEEAVQRARQSYDSQREEYNLGLVTNLDVLQSLDFLQTQTSALDAARIKSKQFFIQLNVAMEAGD